MSNSDGTNSAIAHERLAIMDPLSGNQPLYSADRKLSLAVNGEIYNYKELRALVDLAVPGAAGTASQWASAVTRPIDSARGETTLEARLRAQLALTWLQRCVLRPLHLARTREGGHVPFPA